MIIFLKQLVVNIALKSNTSYYRISINYGPVICQCDSGVNHTRALDFIALNCWGLFVYNAIKTLLGLPYVFSMTIVIKLRENFTLHQMNRFISR